MESDCARVTPGHTQPRVVVLRCYLPLMVILMINWFFPLGERHNWSHSTKSCSHRCYLPLMPNSMQKKRYNLIFSRDIVESCNWIEPEVYLATLCIQTIILMLVYRLGSPQVKSELVVVYKKNSIWELPHGTHSRS